MRTLQTSKPIAASRPAKASRSQVQVRAGDAYRAIDTSYAPAPQGM